MLKILTECLEHTEDRYWCEASGAIEHWLNKKGLRPHPNEWVAELLEKEGNEIEYCDDGIHYIRKINGVTKVKAIYGNLCDSKNNYNS